MSEMIKTVLFLGVASALAIGAVLSRPQNTTRSLDERVGQPLFEEFTDPLQPASMRITRYDPATLDVIPFEVTQTSKGWIIETKDGYPANATEQMALAANNLIDLKILDIVSDTAGQHAEFGVIEPNPDTLSASDIGVGKMVVIRDDKKKVLANLIIGVADTDKPENCYVRIPGQDPVYLVTLDPKVFTTDFTTWIDRDLLQINPFDVTSFRIRDYESRVTQQGTVAATPRMDVILGIDEELNQWSLLNLKEAAQGGRLEESQLASTEKLNTQRLDDLRSALDELTITGVLAKPVALATALRTTEGLAGLRQSDLPTLVETGFLPGKPPGSDEMALIGTNGELVIQTKDAIRYRLLFGSREELEDGQESRYLFVQAEIETALIPEPELVEVPEVKEGDDVDLEAQAKARDDAIKANQRAEDQYRQRMNAAKRKKLELNTRFAEWYYLISEEDYQKIAIKRDQLATTGEAAPAAGEGSAGPSIPGLNGMIPGLGDPANRPAVPAVEPAAQPSEPEPKPEATDSPAEDSESPAPMPEETPDQPTEEMKEEPKEPPSESEDQGESEETSEPKQTSDSADDMKEDASEEPSEEEEKLAEPPTDESAEDEESETSEGDSSEKEASQE
ncbi:MAG: DUF4340 domain-containing protein [Pirellulaceae bacterium]